MFRTNQSSKADVCWLENKCKTTAPNDEYSLYSILLRAAATTTKAEAALQTAASVQLRKSSAVKCDRLVAGSTVTLSLDGGAHSLIHTMKYSNRPQTMQSTWLTHVRWTRCTNTHSHAHAESKQGNYGHTSPYILDRSNCEFDEFDELAVLIVGRPIRSHIKRTCRVALIGKSCIKREMCTWSVWPLDSTIAEKFIRLSGLIVVVSNVC